MKKWGLGWAQGNGIQQPAQAAFTDTPPKTWLCILMYHEFWHMCKPVCHRKAQSDCTSSPALFAFLFYVLSHVSEQGTCQLWDRASRLQSKQPKVSRFALTSLISTMSSPLRGISLLIGIQKEMELAGIHHANKHWAADIFISLLSNLPQSCENIS